MIRGQQLVPITQRTMFFSHSDNHPGPYQLNSHTYEDKLKKVIVCAGIQGQGSFVIEVFEKDKMVASATGIILRCLPEGKLTKQSWGILSIEDIPEEVLKAMASNIEVFSQYSSNIRCMFNQVYIRSIYTDEEYRRCGIASSIISYIHKQYRADKILAVDWGHDENNHFLPTTQTPEIVRSNLTVHQFLVANGFRKGKTIMLEDINHDVGLWTFGRTPNNI